MQLTFLERITGRPEQHCAFTDMAYWNGKYYVSFREASSHLSMDGRLVIMSSPDLKSWHKEYFANVADLRDAKFLVVPEGLLMFGWARTNDPDSDCEYICLIDKETLTVAKSSKAEIAARNVFWRPKRVSNKYYVATYTCTSAAQPNGHVDSEAWLFSSDDALHWERVSRILGQEATETEILPGNNGDMIAFIRQDGPYYPTMAIGISKPPFTDWQIIDSGKIIHAAAACHWQDRIIVVGRYMKEPFPNRIPGDENPPQGEALNRNIRTMIWSWSIENGFEELLELPSQGDCSYAGIVPEKDRLVISYYSQHELIARDPGFNTMDGGAEVFVATVAL